MEKDNEDKDNDEDKEDDENAPLSSRTRRGTKN